MAKNMISQEQVDKLVKSKDALAEFTTQNLIHVITAGTLRVQDPDVTPSAVSQYADMLRKLRADLTGDNHETKMPSLLVSLQFGQSNEPVEVAIEEAPAPAKPALTASDQDLLAATEELFVESNLDE